MEGRTVGTLRMTPERDRSVFEYDKDWIASGFSISPWELPLQTGLIYSKENSFGGGFATFEDSIPDGYGLYLLDRILRRGGNSLSELSTLQRLSLVGSSGMGALCYKPEVSKEHIAAITDNDFDELQHKAFDVLSEKSDADASFLYYNSRNSGGTRLKAIYKAADGSDWIVKFRHIYDPSDIGKLHRSPCPDRRPYTRSSTSGADVSQDGFQYHMRQQGRSRQKLQFPLRKRQMVTCSRIRHYLLTRGHQRRTRNICQIFGQSKP